MAYPDDATLETTSITTDVAKIVIGQPRAPEPINRPLTNIKNFLNNIVDATTRNTVDSTKVLLRSWAGTAGTGTPVNGNTLTVAIQAVWDRFIAHTHSGHRHFAAKSTTSPFSGTWDNNPATKKGLCSFEASQYSPTFVSADFTVGVPEEYVLRDVDYIEVSITEGTLAGTVKSAVRFRAMDGAGANKVGISTMLLTNDIGVTYHIGVSSNILSSGLTISGANVRVFDESSATDGGVA